jgi:hypothetical protein
MMERPILAGSAAAKVCGLAKSPTLDADRLTGLAEEHPFADTTFGLEVPGSRWSTRSLYDLA